MGGFTVAVVCKYIIESENALVVEFEVDPDKDTIMISSGNGEDPTDFFGDFSKDELIEILEKIKNS